MQPEMTPGVSVAWTSDAAQSPRALGHRRIVATVLAAVLPIVAVGLALRWQHVRNYETILSGDDGVVALMGRHMMTGQGFPLVFYGQHYMGTLDAMVAALFFYWFGASAETYKLTVLLFAGGTLLIIGWAVGTIWGWARAAAALGLLALSPAAIRWQMDQPNYGLLFLFGAAVMAVTIRLTGCLDKPAAWSLPWVCLWAFLAGVGFWANSLILSLLLSFLAVLWLGRALPPGRTLIPGALCFSLGMLPLVLHNVVYPLATLRQFAGFFLNVSARGDIQDLSPVAVVLEGLGQKFDPMVVGRNVLVAVGGFGLTDYSGLALASYPAFLCLICLVLSTVVVWAKGAKAMGWRAWVSTRRGSLLTWLLLSLGLVVFLGSTRTRYMALLVLILPVLLVGRWTDFLWFRRLQAATLAGLLLYLAVASLLLNVTRPMTFTNPVPALAEFLLSKGLTRGYSGFELAYPLAFQTGEVLRLSPLAGPRVDDLYPPYTLAVEAAPSPFYLYPEQEPLAQALSDYLRHNKIGFEATSIHHHLVFSRLTRPVRPDEFLPEPYLTAYRRSHADGGTP